MSNGLLFNISDFELFFREHYQDLCGYAYKMTGDVQEAEDIVQLFFVKLWEERETLRIDSFRPYAYRAVKNRCLNLIIRNSKFQNESVENLVNEIIADIPPDDDHAYAYRDKARKAIRKIPPKSRKILLMHCILGLKYQEIADVLGISQNTVKSQIAVAYKIMKDDLQSIFTILFLLWLNHK